MNIDGTNEKKLTDSIYSERYAAWSPDSKKIAYAAFTGIGNNWEIYVMNDDGSGKIQLTNHPEQDSRPTWSPDGTAIAFYSNRDGPGRIYIMDSDGANVRSITGGTRPDWSSFLKK